MKKKKRKTSRSRPLDSREIGKKLVAWFKKNQRPLPWRCDYDPYAVWISEVMLQQTQVSTVIPYFKRWMERLPDPAAVAEANEDLLLLFWEGLGYYSRVRNIKKAARQIMEKHDGRIPQDEKTLQTLPGIGEYTAAAVLSLAFNDDVVALDGNGKRVVARISDIDQPVNTSESKKAIQQTLTAWLPKGESREFNQAIMELGATVCTPLRPQCEICPVSAFCRALRNGTVFERPLRNRRAESVPVNAAVGIIVNEKKVWIQKRPPEGLMASLWEFPGGKMKGKESPKECLRRELLQTIGGPVRVIKKLAVIRHAYTKFRVRLHAYLCELSSPGQTIVLRTAVEGKWIFMDELDHFAFPAAHRRLITILRQKDP
jgi:A/G-specific adenine glycosylase